MFKPIVQEVATETGTSIQFIDAEQNAQLAAQYNVTGVPTIVITDGVNTIRRHTGVMTKQQLKGFIQ